MSLVRVESFVSPGVVQSLWINPDTVKVVTAVDDAAEPMSFIGFKEAVELPLPANLKSAEPYIRTYTASSITVKGSAGEIALLLSQGAQAKGTNSELDAEMLRQSKWEKP